MLELRKKIVKKINDKQNEIHKMQNLLLEYDYKQINNNLTHIKYTCYKIMKGGTGINKVPNKEDYDNTMKMIRFIGNSIEQDHKYMLDLTHKITTHEETIDILKDDIKSARSEATEDAHILYSYLSIILNNIFSIYMINNQINIEIEKRKQFQDESNIEYWKCMYDYEKIKETYIYSIDETKNILIINITPTDNLYTVLIKICKIIININNDSERTQYKEHMKTMHEYFIDINTLMNILFVLIVYNDDIYTHDDSSDYPTKYIEDIIKYINTTSKSSSKERELIISLLLFKIYLCIIYIYDSIKDLIFKMNTLFELNINNSHILNRSIAGINHLSEHDGSKNAYNPNGIKLTDDKLNILANMLNTLTPDSLYFPGKNINMKNALVKNMQLVYIYVNWSDIDLSSSKNI